MFTNATASEALIRGGDKYTPFLDEMVDILIPRPCGIILTEGDTSEEANKENTVEPE